MNLPFVDASNYFKGMLLLIRKDRHISEREFHFIKRLGKALGFEKQFCENAIHEILDNSYIVDTPPLFSTTAFAMQFIKNGLIVANSGKEAHLLELEWLQTTALKNGVDMKWFREEVCATKGKYTLDTMTFE